MKKKLITIISMVLVLTMACVLFVGCGTQVGKDTATATDEYFSADYGNYAITVKLIIENPDKTKDPLFSGTVELKTIKHMAYEAVEAACEAKSIAIVGLNGYGSFISSIAGIGYVENKEDGTYSSWTTSINGKFSAGMGAQQLREGDVFTVAYETKEKTW